MSGVEERGREGKGVDLWGVGRSAVVGEESDQLVDGIMADLARKKSGTDGRPALRPLGHTDGATVGEKGGGGRKFFGKGPAVTRWHDQLVTVRDRGT